MTYSDLVLADNPLLYLPLDGSVTNSGSTSVTLTDTGLAYEATDRGQAMVTTSDYIDVTGVGNFASDKDFTVETWFRMPTATTSRFLFQAGSLAAQQVVTAYAVASGGVLRAYARFGGAAAYYDIPNVQDNQWHHLVMVGTAAAGITVYLDGTAVNTFAVAGTPSLSNAITIGNDTPHSAGTYWSGGIDEFAIYPTALSAAQVASHYAGPAASTNVTVDVPTVTVSAQANDVTLADNTMTVTLTATADGDQIFGGSGETMKINPNYGLVNFDMSALVGANIVSAQLGLYVTVGGSSPQAAVRRATSAWTEASPIATSTATNEAGFSAAVGAKSVNVTALTQDIVNSGQMNGYRLSGGPDPTTVIAREGTVAEQRPTLTVVYVPAPVDIQLATAASTLAANDVTVENGYAVDVTTLSVSAQAHEATVESDADTSVETATASLSAFDVTVEESSNPNNEVLVETATASLQAPEADVSGSALEVTETATFATNTNDVTVEVASNEDIELDTPRILTTHIGLTDVNGEPIVPTEGEDPYFNSTMFNRPEIWYRFNDAEAPPVPRAYNDLPNLEERAGRLTGGVVIGLNGGPNSRKYFHFDGTGMFEQWEASQSFNPTNERFSNNSTLEFSIRTTKKNQFVMRMDDRSFNVGDNLSIEVTPRDIYLSDGKLVFKVWKSTVAGVVNNSTTVGEVQWTGFTDIADGEWHHIVIVNEADLFGDVFSTPRANVYIDGRFELRNRGFGVSFPDFIGGRPNLSGGYYPTLPASDWFIGDVTEVASYNEYSMTADSVARQYDNLFGFQPYYAETARATVKAGEASIKSNTKRVLLVDLRAPSTLDGNPTYHIDGERFGFSGLVAEGASLTNGVRRGPYQIFSVRATTPSAGINYYDERTNEPRLLDLAVDVNLEDFDVVNIVNYPTNSNDFNFYEETYGRPALFGGLGGRQQVEKIVNDVKQFAVNGGGVFVSDPQVASAMGIINDVEFVPHMQERKDPTVDTGNSYSNWKDLRAAQINPWGLNKGELNKPNVAVDGPIAITPEIEKQANFYYDLHSNRMQRVVNLVEGLTDLPGDILVDAMAYSAYVPTGAMEAEKYEERPDGLNVGDEFWIMGTPMAGRSTWWDDEAYGGAIPIDDRTKGYPAVPLSAIRAGVPVTTFASKTWQGADAVDNPYKNHAVTIAVRPGDLLDGSVMAGRIFVSFTEGFVEAATSMFRSTWDIIPPNEELRLDWQESDYAREWSWSMWRGAWNGNSAEAGSGGSTVSIDGGQVVINPAPTDVMTGVTYTGRYDQRRANAPTIHYRGLNWLAADLDDDGSASVGVETATVTAKADDATAESQVSADITVATARVITNAYTDADTVVADADVLVTTPGVTVQAQPFTEAVDLTTAVVTAQSYDDADGVLLTGDWVVLRLPSHRVNLSLEDK